MDVATSLAKMDAQVGQARTSRMAQSAGWRFEQEQLVLFVELRRVSDSKLFLIRAQFDDFDRRAPSYCFVDPESKVAAVSAAPANALHDGKNRICTPGTREFHEEIHKDDAQYLWNPQKYTVLDTLRMIERIINQQ